MLAASGLEPPAIVVVGEVVRLRAALDWLGALAGRELVADPLGTRGQARERRDAHECAARLIVAAAASHSGKTTISLGLIAALRARGLQGRRREMRAGLHRPELPRGGERRAGDQPRPLGDAARSDLRRGSRGSAQAPTSSSSKA